MMEGSQCEPRLYFSNNAKTERVRQSMQKKTRELA